MQMCDSSVHSSAKCFRSPLLENASLLCPQQGPKAPETASPSHLGVPLALTCLPLRLSEMLKSYLSEGKQCEKSNLPTRKISIYKALQLLPLSSICPWLCCCVIKDLRKRASPKQRSKSSSEMNSDLTPFDHSCAPGEGVSKGRGLEGGPWK